MLLVPVLDLRCGQVVHARRGERDAYRPVRSRLVDGCEPASVARALLAACGSRTLYVADLDALLGDAPQRRLWQALRDALPGVALWLDAGFADPRAALAATAALGDATPVLGSESLDCDESLAGRDDLLLSLDRRDGRPLDRHGWWDAPERWPARVIVMTLERVGAGAGPDLQTFAAQRRRAPQQRMIGAGGIRDAADLDAAAAAGAHGWLVASALHDGRLRAHWQATAPRADGTVLADETRR